jgi:ATP-dependent Clp protease ATP-binding subunit ClpA
MIEPSQNLQSVFENSVSVARQHQHEYVTIEHILYGIMCDQESYDMIEKFGADSNFIKTNLEHYLKNNLDDIKNTKVDKPRKTHAVERVLNRCFTQVLFGGRQRIEIADVIIGILSEKNSFAFYFLTKGGLTKEKFVT